MTCVLSPFCIHKIYTALIQGFSPERPRLEIYTNASPKSPTTPEDLPRRHRMNRTDRDDGGDSDFVDDFDDLDDGASDDANDDDSFDRGLFHKDDGRYERAGDGYGRKDESSERHGDTAQALTEIVSPPPPSPGWAQGVGHGALAGPRPCHRRKGDRSEQTLHVQIQIQHPARFQKKTAPHPGAN
jgi:hypothetical protein